MMSRYIANSDTNKSLAFMEVTKSPTTTTNKMLECSTFDNSKNFRNSENLINSSLKIEKDKEIIKIADFTEY